MLRRATQGKLPVGQKEQEESMAGALIVVSMGRNG